ncbi:MAG: DUF1360 domain-containing protein [Micromonosporaceae bacterium]|nr:DUF1360 domain-containing protein [Micromonosporaceae bacterium]
MRLRRLPGEYAPDRPFPLLGYVASGGAYVALVAGLAAAVQLSGRPLPRRISVMDLVLLSVATHKLSRLLAKDAVTSPLRAPFARFEKPAGEAELVEQVRGHGIRHTVGELVTCPFCLAIWVSTVLTAGLVLAPRLVRLVATGLTAVAVSDFLQLAYAAAKKSAGGEAEHGLIGHERKRSTG